MTALTDVANQQRTLAQTHLAGLLDDLCHTIGADPWEAWRRPRHHARINKQHDLNAQIRANIWAAQGLPPRDRHGRYTSRRT